MWAAHPGRRLRGDSDSAPAWVQHDFLFWFYKILGNMGGCQNYGPFLGPPTMVPYYTKDPKGTILLTTAELHFLLQVEFGTRAFGVSRLKASGHP